MKKRFNTIQECIDYTKEHDRYYGGSFTDDQIEYFFRSLATLVEKRCRRFLADFVVDIFNFRNKARDTLLPSGMFFLVRESGTFLWSALEKDGMIYAQYNNMVNTDVYFIDIHKLHYVFRDEDNEDVSHYDAYHDEEDEKCVIYKIV